MAKTVTDASLAYRDSEPLIRVTVEVPLNEWASFIGDPDLTNALPANVSTHITQVVASTPLT